MFKTTGEPQPFTFACKNAKFGWYAATIYAASRELTKQILIGASLPMRICSPKAS